MNLGVNADLPDSFTQSKPAEQRQVVRTKILGRTEGEIKKSECKKDISEKIARQEAQNKTDTLADKAKDEILDKTFGMRHLKFDVIEDADIVQISVINSGDGTIVRKVPLDRIVNFVRRIKEKDSRRKLDIKA